MKKKSSHNKGEFNSFNSNKGVGAGRIILNPSFNEIVVAKVTSPPPFVRSQQVQLDLPSNATGDQPLSSRIADFDRTYTITIENTQPLPFNQRLFGAKQFAFGGGIIGGAIVTVPESSYNEIQSETLYNPFIVGGMTLQSNTPGQLDRMFRMSDRSTNGTIINEPFHINDYFSVNQFQSNMIEIFPVEFMVNGDVFISFRQLPLSTITFTFYIKKRIRLGEMLHDRPILEVSNDIAPLFNASTFKLIMPSDLK